MMKKLLFTFLAIAFSLFAVAQDTAPEVKEATGLRAEGKIYVVLIVAVTILVGLFIYLVTLDRKISRLEKTNIS